MQKILNMTSINRVQLIGEINGNPEYCEANGNKMVRFTLLTCDFYNENGRKFFDRQWHKIVALGNQAVIAMKYLQKGDEVVIDGSITKRSRIDTHGNTIVNTEIIAHNIMFPFTKRA